MVNVRTETIFPFASLTNERHSAPLYLVSFTEYILVPSTVWCSVSFLLWLFLLSICTEKMKIDQPCSSTQTWCGRKARTQWLVTEHKSSVLVESSMHHFSYLCVLKKRIILDRNVLLLKEFFLREWMDGYWVQTSLNVLPSQHVSESHNAYC